MITSRKDAKTQRGLVHPGAFSEVALRQSRFQASRSYSSCGHLAATRSGGVMITSRKGAKTQGGGYRQSKKKRLRRYLENGAEGIGAYDQRCGRSPSPLQRAGFLVARLL